MKHGITILYLIFVWPKLMAQHSILDTQEDLKSQSLGKIHAVSYQVKSGISNPAFLSFNTKKLISIQSGNFYFLNPQFYHHIFASTKLSEKFTMGAGVYHESGLIQSNLISSSFAHRLSKEASIGLRINYGKLTSAESFNRQIISFDFGLQSKITSKFYAGILIKNPIPIKIAHSIKSTSVFELGILYTNQNNFNIAFQLRSTNFIYKAIQCGIEYFPVNYLPCRLGFDSNSSNYYFGLGFYKIPKIRFDISASLHLLLGSSISLSLTKEF